MLLNIGKILVTSFFCVEMGKTFEDTQLRGFFSISSHEIRFGAQKHITSASSPTRLDVWESISRHGELHTL